MTRKSELKANGDVSLSGLIDKDVIASLLDVSPRSVQRYIPQGKVPRPIRVGKGLRWRLNEILDWIAAGCPKAAEWQRLRGA